MEVAALPLRIVGCLFLFALIHWAIGRKTEAAGVIQFSRRSPPLEIFPLLLLLGMVPVFDSRTLLFAADYQPSLLGIWILLPLSLIIRLLHGSETVDSALDAFAWVVGWGLSVCAVVTVFSQLDLEHLGHAQDGTVIDLLPAWTAVRHPPAMLIALASLLGWVRGLEPAARTLSPQSAPGLLNAALIATTVAVFAGAWHLPWISDATLAEWMGGSMWLLAVIGWLAFATKCAALWLLLAWLATKPLDRFRWFTGFHLGMLAATNLAVTWVSLAVEARW